METHPRNSSVVVAPSRPLLSHRGADDDFYDRLGRELDAESRSLFPDMAPEGRELLPIAEAADAMGRSVSETRNLAEAGLLFAQVRGGELYVEPAVLSTWGGESR